MGINSDHLIGFLLGLGASALGHHYYKKNKPMIDALIRDARQQAEPTIAQAMDGLALEELLLMKERLEDMIAEREGGPVAEAEPESEPEEKPTEEKSGKKKQSKKK